MCGRFVIDKSWEEVERHYNIDMHSVANFSALPDYNIPPAAFLPVVIKKSQEFEILNMKWGLIPSWSKDSNTAYNTINARIESIEQKPAFRKPFRFQRCLVPASGFYEWDKSTSPKQPVYIHLKDKEIFSFGGLWEKTIISKTNETLYSFSIITIPANEAISAVHDRMPLIIDSNNYELWLKNEVLQLEEKATILQSSNNFLFEMHKVSRAVNNPKNNNADLIRYN
jgi:putative SOS response-associated peptidase YedK